MFDGTPDIDFIMRDSGVLLAHGARDEEQGYGIVDDYDEIALDVELSAFIGKLIRVTTKRAAFGTIAVGDQMSFNGGVHEVVKTGITNDGELCESFVIYQEPAIVNEAQVRAIISSVVQPVLYVEPGDGLNAAIQTLNPLTGGTIALADAPYYGDPLNPTVPVLADRPIEFLGLHQLRSGIQSPVLATSPFVGFKKLFVRPPGAAYGVRIYNNGAFIARCWFDEVIIGPTQIQGTDGPTDGIQLDGAGLLEATHLTAAYCPGNGLIADSTGLEPNTTLNFHTCTFNLNGGYGVKLLQSTTVARFDGGNMEDNSLGEVYCENVSGIHFNGVDFERSDVPNWTVPVVGKMIEFENCNNISIKDCNFLMGNGKATTAWLWAGCNGGEYDNNRFGGWGAVGVLRIGETCRNIKRGVNHIPSGGGWIEDYSHS